MAKPLRSNLAGSIALTVSRRGEPDINGPLSREPAATCSHFQLAEQKLLDEEHPLASRTALCYVCAMSETTTIRLPPKLRARLRSIAKETDRSVHSLILEAVEKHAAYEEQMRSLVKEALAADEEIDRTGEVYRAEDVHAWAERLAQGIASPRPKPWRK
jgi:predicted transcriptional regulator